MGTPSDIAPHRLAGVTVALVGIGAVLAFLAPRVPHPPAIDLEARGAAVTGVGAGALLALAGVGLALGRRRGLRVLPACAAALVSLGLVFVAGGAGYDPVTGTVSSGQLAFVGATAAGLVLLGAGSAAVLPTLAPMETTRRGALLMSAPFAITALLLLVLWGTAVAPLVRGGGIDHGYHRAGAHSLFWAVLLVDVAVSTPLYLVAAALLGRRHHLAAPVGFLAGSWLAAHFTQAITIELTRLALERRADWPLLAIAVAIVASAVTVCARISSANKGAPARTAR